jgi:hypothetical protein
MSVGHIDRRSCHVYGAYRQEVFLCLGGIPTGSVFMSVGRTARDVLRNVHQVSSHISKTRMLRTGTDVL